MKIVEKTVKSLKLADYNPRKINGKQMDELKDSIRLFGMTEPIVINMHKGRENIIISGHQRVTACKELEIKKVPCYELDLDLKKEKELNVRMNKAGGVFDMIILQQNFKMDDLLEYGFMDYEFPTTGVDEKLEELQNTDEAVYPIVSTLSEKYDYVIIVAKNELDLAFLDNFFEVEAEKSYKNSKVGVSRVVSFDKFRAKVKKDGVG